MNSRNRLFYSLSAVLLVAGCGEIGGERRTAHVERKWPAGQIRRVEVQEVDGAISVEAAPTDHIELTADVRSRGVEPKPNAENQGWFETELSGDTLTIGRRERHRFRFHFFQRDSVRVDYTLRVPANVALDLHTVNGRIASRGTAAPADLSTINGTIRIDSPGSAEVAAKTVNGRIEARFEHDFQGASLKTINGRVMAMLPSTASFIGDFTQVNGDFEAAFPLTIHSHPGSRRVSGEVNGGRYELRITTVNGDIKIDNTGVPPAPPTPPAPPAAVAPPAPTT